MSQNKKFRRYRYLMKSEKEEEHRDSIRKQFNGRDTFTLEEAIYYLRLQGYNMDKNDILKLLEKMYNKNEYVVSVDQIIGIIARVSIDEQLQRQMKKIFNFFSNGQKRLGLNELKNGFQRLGQNLKQRQINEILMDLDLNSNGFIDFQIFLQAMIIE